MNEEEIYKRDLMKKVVESPLFPQMRKDIRSQIMEEMMQEKNADRRNELFWEAQALDRIIGKMTSYANDVRALPPEQKKGLAI